MADPISTSAGARIAFQLGRQVLKFGFGGRGGPRRRAEERILKERQRFENLSPEQKAAERQVAQERVTQTRERAPSGRRREEVIKAGAIGVSTAARQAVIEGIRRAIGAIRGKPSRVEQVPRTGKEVVIRGTEKGRGVIKRETAPQTSRPARGNGRRRGTELEEIRPRAQRRTERRTGVEQQTAPTPVQMGPAQPAPVATAPSKSLFPAVPIALGTAAIVGGLVSRDLLRGSSRASAGRGRGTRPPSLDRDGLLDRLRRSGPTPGVLPRAGSRPGGSGPAFPPDPLTLSNLGPSAILGAGFGSTSDPFLRSLLAQLAGTRGFSFAQAQSDIRQKTRTRQKTKECQEVLRRRRRKGKCREGFFEELPGKTRFTTWRIKDCASGKTISEV